MSVVRSNRYIPLRSLLRLGYSTQNIPKNHRRPNYVGFYTSILEQPGNGSQEDASVPQDASSKAAPGVVFYSRLAGYPELEKIPSTVRRYAGIDVPPKPDEPLNCCQSGCMHCVWDIFREDVEFYQEKRNEARAALVKSGNEIPIALGGQGEQPDMISLLDPTLQAFIKLEKELKDRKLRREPVAS